jgi:siroheme synthase-like protein
MHYYPIFLDVRGRRAVVVGGGKVAERKVRTLLGAGAKVRVISPELTPQLARWAAQKKISVAHRRYRQGDLAAKPQGGAPFLLFAATNDLVTQRAVGAHGRFAGALVNRADEASDADFIVPASFAGGGMHVAISTSGASPALARMLRRRLQVILGKGYGERLRRLRAARKQVLASVPAQKERAKVFRELAVNIRKVKSQRSNVKRQR